MYAFDSKIIRTDVTLVQLTNKHIIAAVGNFLHFYSKKTLKLISKERVFDHEKIFGIVSTEDEGKTIIYGENKMKLYKDNAFENEICSSTKPTDWILAAKWINDDTRLATISMHNNLLIWNKELQVMYSLVCEEKCILYSALICHNNENIIVLAGTVFNEILIWSDKYHDGNKENRTHKVLKRLKQHKGVIFSIDYSKNSGYICTTSDDRSAVLWQVQRKDLFLELQENSMEIHQVCHVYGHSARVFRCKILENSFLTAGEDSTINNWDFEGKLIRKIDTPHQGGPIWAFDCDEPRNMLLTAGGDSGVSMISIRSDFEEKKLLLPQQVPKLVAFLCHGNLVAVSENGILFFYQGSNESWTKINEFEDLKSYSLLEVSSCQCFVALAGITGQIYLYQATKNELNPICSYQSTKKSRIFSFHWLTCKSFLTCQNEGILTLFHLNENCVHLVTKFTLPPSKERWTTAACFTEEPFIILGDRKGHLHLYEIGKTKAIQTLKKVHNHLGVTELCYDYEKNRITSLGRNGVIKKFTIKNKQMQLLSSDKVPFSWLATIFENMLFAFSGNNFVVWNCDNKRNLFEINCGGGHRSWDIDKYLNKVNFIYIKDKIINLVKINWMNLSSIPIIAGYHVKEVNSVKAIQMQTDEYLLISGSEDTTLRITRVKKSFHFTQELNLKSHLSSIRAIATFEIQSEKPQKHLIFSGGGRAQIVCWELAINNKIVDCSEQHSYYEKIDPEESEIRIMDLNVIKLNEKIILLSACSDGVIKVFEVDKNTNKNHYEITFYKNVFYQLKCIIKICSFNILNRTILVTMATDGNLVFWDLTNLLLKNNQLKPFTIIKIHQSGINSFSYKILPENLVIFLTGGDDNAIHLNLLQFWYDINKKSVDIKILDDFCDVGTHCAQITGVFICDKYFLTTSIDQRLAVFTWQISNDKLVCEFLKKHISAVADIQGMQCFQNDGFDVFVYGKGLELIKVYLTKPKP